MCSNGDPSESLAMRGPPEAVAMCDPSVTEARAPPLWVVSKSQMKTFVQICQCCLKPGRFFKMSA